VFGTRSRLELDLPFNPPNDRPHRALLELDGRGETIEFNVCDQYGIQADSFSRAILDDTDVLTPFHDAVSIMRVIDALVRSSKRGSCEHPG
jgi:predicted dehydrogenase